MDAKPLTAEEEAIARRNDKKIDMTLDDIIKMSKKNVSKGKSQRVSNKSQFFNGGAAGAAKGNSGKMQRFMDSRSSVRQGYLAKRRSNFQDNQFPLAAEAARKAVTSSQVFNILPVIMLVDFLYQVMKHFVEPWELRQGHDVMFLQFSLGTLREDDEFALLFHLTTGVLVQRNEGSFIVKKQLQMKAPIKPKAQTLDSLFANMKEQRMKAQQSNGHRGFGAQQRQGRRRFANFGRWGN
ncbi:hypothetical protein Sjap_021142 [Stephania japonica]|uniref:Uncharacterized protein n=1 Tax=Stephania japonica TaxID=461633 RepID=A0AAP0HW72_9MAGN